MTTTISPPLPLAEPIGSELTPVEAFIRLAGLPHVVFFDSASQTGQHGRYSFVAADPFYWFEANDHDANPLADLESLWQKFSATNNPTLPPFQGGIAGLFGYDLAGTLEHLPAARFNDFQMPLLAVGLYDVLLAFDHQENQAWIISQGFPETDEDARQERAEARIAQMKTWLLEPPASFQSMDEVRVPKQDLAPQFPVGPENVTSNLSAAGYLDMVRCAVEYIHAGDVYQVNLAQRLLCEAKTDARQLYLKLRARNPAPYSGFLNLGKWQVCSTSPECFLKLRGRNAETHPIKGTRGRSASPEADLFAGDDLQMSEKDRAENLMIVDLLRNDFSRVCLDDSVQVTQLWKLETYAHVKHLVSVIRGELQSAATPFSLLRACFPGGSITGAPKIRAMEIITELEPTARGAYCGSLGYIGFDGQMDSSILIRTVTAGRGWWQLPVGGGIVAQSVPDDEYRETWHKARGLLQTLQ